MVRLYDSVYDRVVQEDAIRTSGILIASFSIRKEDKGRPALCVEPSVAALKGLTQRRYASPFKGRSRLGLVGCGDRI